MNEVIGGSIFSRNGYECDDVFGVIEDGWYRGYSVPLLCWRQQKQRGVFLFVIKREKERKPWQEEKLKRTSGTRKQNAWTRTRGEFYKVSVSLRV